MNCYYLYNTALGELTIEANDKAIVRISFGVHSNEAEQKETELIKEASVQIDEYLKGERTTFSLPIAPEGTPFQQKVWDVLATIPYGETWSYKRVAETVGSPKACRAVGMANNRNPIVIVVPCHRVIGANGALVGYGGGLPIKEHLLGLEKNT